MLLPENDIAKRIFATAASAIERFEMVGDIVLFLTQDAAQCDSHYIESISNATKQDGVACAYGCQIARVDAPVYAKLMQKFNFICFVSQRCSSTEKGSGWEETRERNLGDGWCSIEHSPGLTPTK